MIILKSLVMGAGKVENRRTSDHPNYSDVKIGQNTEKCPGHLDLLSLRHQWTIISQWWFENSYKKQNKMKLE